MAISLSYHKLFTIGVDSLMMLKWSHATGITNIVNSTIIFLQCILKEYFSVLVTFLAIGLVYARLSRI